MKRRSILWTPFLLAPALLAFVGQRRDDPNEIYVLPRSGLPQRLTTENAFLAGELRRADGAVVATATASAMIRTR